MAFKLTDDQTALRDALRDFIGEKVTAEYRRSRSSGAVESDPELWGGFQSLGLFELFAPDSESGVAELGIVAHELGRGVVPESLVDALVAGPYLFHHLLDETQRASLRSHFGIDFLNNVASGQARVGIALGSSARGGDIAERGRGEKKRIDGRYRFVGAPSDIDALVVDIEGNLGICDLRADPEQQVIVTPTELIDGTIKAGEIELRNVAICRLERKVAVEPILRLLRAAEMSGAVHRAVEMTVDYVKTRTQFGVPVGGFQAVQHRLADMYANAEALRALTLFAAWAADHSPDQLNLAAHAACRFACEVSGDIVEGAIQLHGGIGFTWEYDLHFFLRRVKALEALWRPGSEEHSALIEAARAG